jgi:hypothetical protein
MIEELDELNRLFTSKNVEDIIKFYDHFDNADQLIEWMKNRPSAPMKIYEVVGDKDIVIVIPTADHNGEYAKNCANEIFKGQQIVFVESNGPFFNYARSSNFGLRYALRYNPNWIVLSNDDMYKIDDISILKNELSKIVGKADIVFTTLTEYRSRDISIYKSRWLLFLYRHINRYNAIRLKLWDKYNIKFLLRQMNLIRRIFMKTVYTFKLTGSFSVISSHIVSEGDIFDEAFINAFEDVYFSYKISKGNIRTSAIEFKVGDYSGKSLGIGIDRLMRDIPGLAYLNMLLKNDFEG